MTEDLRPAIALATRLRDGGVRTQIYTEPKKFKAKLTYASRLQIPYAVLLGEDEIAAGTAAVKDLATGTQTAVKLEEAAAFIRTGLAAREQGAPIRDKE